MTDELVTRVARWLDAVPHTAECEFRIYPLGNKSLHYECDCGRAQRQAEAVVQLAHKVAEHGLGGVDGDGAPRFSEREVVAQALDAVEREAAP